MESEDEDVTSGDNEPRDESSNGDDSAVPPPAVNRKTALHKRKVEEFNEAQDMKGLVYLSTIPPYMKPEKIRHIFSQFGEIGRVYLAPENPEHRLKRKKAGGNKKKRFTEGWVEFIDKRVAKLVTLSLNNTLIGGKKSSYYRDDIWNIKYLPKFKWHHLTETIAYENQVRNKKLRTELSQSKREIEEYRRRVEKAKVAEKIGERKAKKRAKLAAQRTTDES